MQSQRGKTLMMYGAELTSDDNMGVHTGTDDQEQAENDEINFILQQRVSSKSHSTKKTGSGSL